MRRGLCSSRITTKARFGGAERRRAVVQAGQDGTGQDKGPLGLGWPRRAKWAWRERLQGAGAAQPCRKQS